MTLYTKLDVKFDYDKAWLYGKAWLTLRPHFYPTDSLLLDAKRTTQNIHQQWCMKFDNFGP